jgi:transposase
MEDKVMTNKRDYTGKMVHMGIDVHKKTYCCVSVCEGEVVKRDTMPSNPEGLLAYIHKFFPGATIQTAYEAGFSGFHLHRYLVANGINNIVVHAASIEISARDRVKTDKRDALKIAVQLSTHRLKGIFVPSLERESKRNVSRLRKNFWQLRQRVGGQLKSLLFTQGLIKGNDDTKICQKWITEKLSEIEKGNYPKYFFYSVKRYAKEWEDLTEKIKEILGELKIQAEGERSIQTIYESVPGIGLIHARELANELGDMRQFRNEKKLFSYTGLTPSEYSSGEHVCQGHISRQGRPVLRKILVEASWVAINKDPSLREVYNRLSHRGGKRAIVGVARRLVGRIRSCLLNGILYEIKSKKEEIVIQEMICATS